MTSAISYGAGKFAFTYTNAGREQTQTDPLTGTQANSAYTLVGKSMSYDAYGQLNGLTLPRALNPETSITNDLEGSIVSAGWTGMAGGTYQFTTRNEVPGVNAGTTSYVGTQFANGAECAVPHGQSSFDSRSGQMLSQQGPYQIGSSGSATAVHAYTYDPAGRQITDTLSCQSLSPVTATRSYDADNHIVQQVLPNNFVATLPVNNGGLCGQGDTTSSMSSTYAWSADGRLATLTVTSNAGAGPSTSTVSAHWDGDDLLYVGNASTNSLSLYIEKLGVVSWTNGSSSNPMMIYDRDQSGTAVNQHWFNGGSDIQFGQLNIDNVHPHARCQPKDGVCTGSGNMPGASLGGPSDPIGADQEMTWDSGAPLDASREDGYFDGSIAIQGVRAYDPNMNQWTSPDAYSGDVHDPMSQHPYMWNGNNPVSYSDPSGYVAQVATDTGDGGQINVTITMYVAFSPNTSDATKTKIKNDIAKTWGGQAGKYNVTMNVLEANSSTPASLVNQIKVGAEGTHFGGDWHNSTMTCDANGLPTAYGHEAGHLMGLVDGYLGAGTNHAQALPAPGRDKDDIMVRLGGHPTEGDIGSLVSPSNTWVIHQ